MNKDEIKEILSDLWEDYSSNHKLEDSEYKLATRSLEKDESDKLLEELNYFTFLQTIDKGTLINYKRTKLIEKMLNDKIDKNDIF